MVHSVIPVQSDISAESVIRLLTPSFAAPSIKHTLDSVVFDNLLAFA